MKIQTTRFGEIEVEDKFVIDFTMPILGYNEEEQFVMIESKEASLFKWIQSTHTPDLAFPATIPSFFGIDYTFELPDEAEASLDVKSAEDLIVMNIAKIPGDNPRKTTVNLLAPIVFNVNNNKAGQVVLSGTGLDVTYPLLKDEAPKKEGE